MDTPKYSIDLCSPKFANNNPFGMDAKQPEKAGPKKEMGALSIANTTYVNKTEKWVAMAESPPRGARPADFPAMSGSGPRPSLLLIIRLLQLGLSASVVGVLSRTSQHSVSYQDFSGLVMGFGVNALTVIYTAILVLCQIGKMCSASRFWERRGIFYQLVLDFVLLILLFSASCASGTTMRQINSNVKSFDTKSMQLQLQPSLCSQLKGSGSFCRGTEAAVTLSFLGAFLFVYTFWLFNTEFYW